MPSFERKGVPLFKAFFKSLKTVHAHFQCEDFDLLSNEEATEWYFHSAFAQPKEKMPSSTWDVQPYRVSFL